MAPILGDADEPLGTGVLGDVGGGSSPISGSVQAGPTTCSGYIRRNLQGGGWPDISEEEARAIAAKRKRDAKARAAYRERSASGSRNRT
jgi:hypothetical protein